MSLVPIFIPSVDLGVTFPTIGTAEEMRYRSDVGITKDGSDFVATWADQSGNGVDLTEATNKPIHSSAVQINGFDTVQFDGANDQLRTSTFTSKGTNIHIFIVLIKNTWVSGNKIFTWSATQNNQIVDITSTPTIEMQARQFGVNDMADLTLGTAHLLQMYADDTTGSFLKVDNNSAVTGGDPGDGVWTQTNLGGAGNESDYSDYDVAELVCYNSEITGSDLTTLENYFNARYALW